MAKKFRNLVAGLAMTAAVAVAGAAPVLQQSTPLSVNYMFGAGQDFTVAEGSGFGDVTAALFAVDLDLVPTNPGVSTSGCEAADFAGFVPGSIALIQRGTCTFGVKVFNAFAAGALGVLLYNEGDTPGRLDAVDVTLGGSTSVPVFFASYAVGAALNDGAIASGPMRTIVRMKLTQDDLLEVPLPGTLALVGAGLFALAGLHRRAK